jgi:hypothetical protein
VNRGTASAKFLTVYFDEQGKPLVEHASDSVPRRLKTTTVLQTLTTSTGEPILPVGGKSVHRSDCGICPRRCQPTPCASSYRVCLRVGWLSHCRAERPFSRGPQARRGMGRNDQPHVGTNRGTVAHGFLPSLRSRLFVPLTLPVP